MSLSSSCIGDSRGNRGHGLVLCHSPTIPVCIVRKLIAIKEAFQDCFFIFYIILICITVVRLYNPDNVVK